MNLHFKKVAVVLSLALLLPAFLPAETTIPAGTSISVTTSQSVSSKCARVGQSVPGNVSGDVTVGGGQEGHRVSCGSAAFVYDKSSRERQLILKTKSAALLGPRFFFLFVILTLMIPIPAALPWRGPSL